jgi:outer membrane protein assembly factor BamA
MRNTIGRTAATVSTFSLTVFLFTISFAPAALAQAQGGPPRDLEEGFTVKPIPIIQPVTEEGAGLALVYRYHFSSQHKKSSSSSTALGGFVTGNRSWGAGVSQKLYFKDDRWRARMAGSYADIRYNYYGIGTAAGEAGGFPGISVLLEQRGPGALGELLYRFHELWYGGAQYRFVKVKSSYRPNPQFNASVIPPSQLDLSLGSFGPRISRDSRSDENYPRDGSLLDLQAAFHGQAVGSDLNYQIYDLSYSKYFSVSPSQVLAVRGASCFTRGHNPFFDQCLLSASENLRGYRASRYRDNTMLAAQGEYRWEAFWRVGFVVFAGAGEVGPSLSDFNSGNVLPGGGIGVRYRVTRESHVNIRFDYAWGKSSRESYFFIGEAF